MNHPEEAEVATALYELILFALRRRQRDMSLTSMSTLDTLERTGPRRLTELAAVEGVAQPSMTALVAQLERSGYVERQREPLDGRVVLVAISGAGRALLRERRRDGAEVFAARLRQLPTGDRAALAAALPALRLLRSTSPPLF